MDTAVMSVTKLHRLITSRPWTKQSLKHVCFTRYTGVYGNKQSLIIVYGKYYTLNKYNTIILSRRLICCQHFIHIMIISYHLKIMLVSQLII